MPHKLCKYNQGAEVGEDTRNALQNPKPAGSEFSFHEQDPRNQTTVKVSTAGRNTCFPFEL